MPKCLLMKKILVAALLCFSWIAGQAALSIPTYPKPVPEYLQVKNFIHLSVSEFQQASGKKLSLFQKMYFKKLQRQIKRAKVPLDATILPYYDTQKKKFKFDALWFVLGCIIGPFALLFAFTSKQPKHKRLSALIGFGVFVLWFGWLFLF